MVQLFFLSFSSHVTNCFWQRCRDTLHYYILSSNCDILALILAYVDVSFAFASLVKRDVWHKASRIGLYSFASCVNDTERVLSSGVVANPAKLSISQ